MTEQILESVKSKYGAVAESSLSTDNAGVKAVAEAFGYTPEELTSIPAEANMGLSCGNPTATAHIRPGLRTRAISRKTAGLSGARLSTQFEMTQSTEASGSGIRSMVDW